MVGWSSAYSCKIVFFRRVTGVKCTSEYIMSNDFTQDKASNYASAKTLENKRKKHRKDKEEKHDRNTTTPEGT